MARLWFKTEEEQGGLGFLLVTLSQTGRAEEAGREGRNRKAKLFSKRARSLCARQRCN